MASGLPVVAAGAGGPVDHVFKGQNGFLSDPDDKSDLAALVWRCFNDDAMRRRMAAAARAYAETQTWEMILDGLLENYATLIREGPRVHPPMTLTERWRARQEQGGKPLVELFRPKE